MLVQAPMWGQILSAYATPEGPCGVSNNLRACGSPAQGFVVSPHVEQLRFEGVVDGQYHFSDGGHQLFSASSFMGALTLTHEGPTTLNPTNEPWDARLCRVDEDGNLLFAKEGRMVRAPLPGRAYDGRFFDERVGVAFVEPGWVMATTDGGTTFSRVTLSGPPPRSVAALPSQVIPSNHTPADWSSLETEDESLRAFHDEWFRWLRELAADRGVTVPDLPPGVAVPWNRPDPDWPEGRCDALADGWVLRDLRGRAYVARRDGPLEQRNAQGDALVSRDGQVSLTAPTWPRLGANALTPETYAAPDATYPLRLPPAYSCATVAALAPNTLVLGGDGCPDELCHGAPLVRVAFDETGVRDVVPYTIDGVPLRAPARGGCSMMQRHAGSPHLVDGDQLRTALPFDGGLALVTGPLEGPLRATALPASDGHVAFADARHGVFAATGAVWLTSDGGATWRSAPATGDALSRPPACSRDACRVGSAYWASPAFAAALQLQPATDVVFGARPANWRLAEWPWDPPPPTLPELPPVEQCVSAHGESPVFLGGALVRVRQDPRGTPLRVSWWTHAGRGGQDVRIPSRARPSRAESWMALAATPELLVLRVDPREERMRLVFITRSGRVRQTALPLLTPASTGDLDDRPQGFVPLAMLPRESRGLALLFTGTKSRLVVDVDAQGTVRHVREIGAFALVRNEALVEHAGKVGLAVQSARLGTQFYAADGTSQTIARLETPEGPCPESDGAGDETAYLRAASLWHTPVPSGVFAMYAGLGLGPAPLVFSRHAPGLACIEAITLGADAVNTPSAPVVRGEGEFVATCVDSTP